MPALIWLLVWVIALILVIWVVERLASLPPFNVSRVGLILVEVIVAVIALLLLLSHFGMVSGL